MKRTELKSIIKECIKEMVMSNELSITINGSDFIRENAPAKKKVLDYDQVVNNPKRTILTQQQQRRPKPVNKIPITGDSYLDSIINNAVGDPDIIADSGMGGFGGGGGSQNIRPEVMENVDYSKFVNAEPEKDLSIRKGAKSPPLTNISRMK